MMFYNCLVNILSTENNTHYGTRSGVKSHHTGFVILTSSLRTFQARACGATTREQVGSMIIKSAQSLNISANVRYVVEQIHVGPREVRIVNRQRSYISQVHVYKEDPCNKKKKTRPGDSRVSL